MEVTREATEAPVSTPSGGFGAKRRWLQRLNVAFATFLAFYILIAVNVIMFRHPYRIDLTEEGLHSISDESRAKLDFVSEKVRVVAALYESQDPSQAADAIVIQRAIKLLKEYSAYQPLIEAVEVIDVFRHGDRWAATCKKYGLSPSQFNRIIFLAGEDGEFKQSVAPSELAVVETDTQRRMAQIKSFRGDRALSSAILKLTKRERKVVYFSKGHGELVLNPTRGNPDTLLAFKSDLDSSGFDARDLDLRAMVTSGRGVPEDAALLCIASPESLFDDAEVDAIEQFLLRDGRLFVALGTGRTGLEPLLEKWGVGVREGRVMTRFVVPGQKTDRDWVRVGEFNAAHKVTAPFRNLAHFESLFFLPRPLYETGGQKTMRTAALVSTGPSKESESFLLVEGSNRDLSSDEEKGNFTLAIAVEPDIRPKRPPGWVDRKTRMVVASSSNFLRDHDKRASVLGGYLSASHRDFLTNSFFWLTGDEKLLTAGGRETEKRQLRPLDDSVRSLLFFASVLIFPGVFAFLGAGVYFLRRS
ncbi:MAG: GldG family protein [Planctomycetota bacterium]